jgi:hypothetical protein
VLIGGVCASGQHLRCLSIACVTTTGLKWSCRDDMSIRVPTTETPDDPRAPARQLRPGASLCRRDDGRRTSLHGLSRATGETHVWLGDPVPNCRGPGYRTPWSSNPSNLNPGVELPWMSLATSQVILQSLAKQGNL